MSAVWFLFVLALVAAVGAWIDESYNFLADANLPDWFDPDERTVAAWVSAIGLAFLSLVAATIGGRIGQRHHVRAAEAIATYDERDRYDEHDLRDEHVDSGEHLDSDDERVTVSH
jgi:hypothetical protein